MTDLTREHCEKLKDWGMPQRVGKGSWVWWLADGVWDGPSIDKPHLVGVDIISLELGKAGIDWVLIPSLDALMDFARGLAKERNAHPDSNYDHCVWWIATGHLPPHEEGWYLTVDWDFPGEPNVFGALTPKLVVYALIAKLKEVERGDK